MGFRLWFKRNFFEPGISLSEPGDELQHIPQEDLYKPESFPNPLDYYIQVYKTAQELLRTSFNGKAPYSTDANIRRILATYAIGTKGFEALPFAIVLLQDKEPEFREDGSSILMSLGKDETILETIKKAIEHETDLTVLSGFISALPKVGGKKAISILAPIIRNPDADSDIQWEAMYSLGKIVRKRFEEKSDNPIESAKEWLNKNGY